MLCVVVYRPYSDPHSRVCGSNRASHIPRVRGYRRGYAMATPHDDRCVPPVGQGQTDRLRVGPPEPVVEGLFKRCVGQLRERGAARQPNHQLHAVVVDPSHSLVGKRPLMRMERALRTVGRSRGW